ncbi:biotin/lipoyl-binding protein [bacterium]|nr:biotin/lipoyl-binding protein [bacterium]
MTRKKSERRTTRILLEPDARIGIINRGEAAVRFIRAVKEYNTLHGTTLQTVAFFLAVDQQALYVKEANVACPLASLESFGSIKGNAYLNHDLLLEGLATMTCQATWLGWGFLAEDAVFVEKLEKQGLAFIGPTASAMAMLGDKIEAKKLAEKAKVPVCPWSQEPIRDLVHARKVSERIGYPVIIKAAHTGGGRGIRMVYNPEDLERQYKSAVEETQRIAGDSIVFIEYLVTKGRHLEVQIMADYLGHVATFGVRDCSVQRKNQKIIEETPPAHLPQKTIMAMERAAARLIKAAAYENAGTVEFIYDLNRDQFFFMEVNTRLQVEHPITETLFNVDLVKMQLDAARGLPIGTDFQPRGSAIELRLNAEDPDRDFTPAPGDVTVFFPPTGPGLRVDSGIEAGSSIPREFDSMIAKIIAHGATRTETISRLTRALQEIRIKIDGGTTNRAFLLELLRCPAIIEGGVHTRFVEELMAGQKSLVRRDDWDIALVVSAIRQYITRYNEELVNFQGKIHRLATPREITRTSIGEISLNLKGHSYNFMVRSVGNNIFHLEIDQTMIVAQYLWQDDQAVLVHELGRYDIQVVTRGDLLQCEINGIPYPLEIESQGVVRAPSPAIVLSVGVQAGQPVHKGELLVTLEAMKMEMIVAAPSDGLVKKIAVREGEQVSAGQPLVELDTASPKDGAEEQVEVEPAVVFDRLAVPPSSQSKKALINSWEILRREFLGVLLGYDCDNPARILKQMQTFTESEVGYYNQFVRTLIDALEIFVAVEKLFSRELMQAKGTARALDSQELLMHFFWRTEDREKGLPEKFLERLNQAISWYPWAVIDNTDACTRALFRIYKSHANLKTKHKLVSMVLFQLEDAFPKCQDCFPGQHLARLLSEIALMCQEKSPSLSDLAIHARYSLLDRPSLIALKEAKSRKVRELLDLLLQSANSDMNHPDRSALLNEVLDAGPRLDVDLVHLATAPDPIYHVLALELAARRYCRDRQMIEGILLANGQLSAYLCKCQQDQDLYSTLVLVLRPEQITAALDWLDVDCKQQADPHEELVLLINADQADQDTIRTIFDRLTGHPFPVKWCCVGVCNDHFIDYRTFNRNDQNEWSENTRLRSLSPVMARELRFQRLDNFALELSYSSETVFVYRAAARTNSKDERIFALVEVPEAQPEFNEQGKIQRIVAFENAFVEVSQAIRAIQAQRMHRLYWNRIIMHVRSPLEASLKRIREYAALISPRARGMGLEKVVIYTRIKRGKKLRETEFLFENISGPLFTLRSRVPSQRPLVAMDAYVAKVVRARQRGMVYPYQIVKMITSTESGNQRFPRGTFEEYDLVKTDQGQYQPVKAMKHSKPDNGPNILFGIINNCLPQHPQGLKRVLILNDPTLDMCALGEAECSRINAALDLAQQERLPVEWVAVSAGARIDMDSGTENLDWTARTLRRIIQFTQQGGEINIIVPGINVGAQSYWNAEATMLMHTRGLLIMTDDGAMLLTGKKALDFSGSISAEDNIGIGGVERVMGPNGQAQMRARDLSSAYQLLLRHYDLTYHPPGQAFPDQNPTHDPLDRDICLYPYNDFLEQGFSTIGDILLREKNAERKKPFDMRQVMNAIIDQDHGYLERWHMMLDAETAIIWETRLGGFATGLIGIESRALARLGSVPNDGPDSWSGGTLFPQSSKKVARALNAWSSQLPVVVLANLSGFDGSPESLRNFQLEYGAEIGRAVVNFKGPILFVIVARYHGGAYVVFSQSLNPHLKAVALEHTYASVIGGAPAAAVVFQRDVIKQTYADPRIIDAQNRLKSDQTFKQQDFDAIFQQVQTEKQTQLAQKFDSIHSVERARQVGSISEIISPHFLRPFLVQSLQEGMTSYQNQEKSN